jgi:hypothetical protein
LTEENKPIVSAEADSLADVFTSMGRTKSRNEVFLDEFIGTVIRVIKIQNFELQTLDHTEPKLILKAKDPYSFEELEYVGTGKTIGHCLRAVLDQINETFPLGGIYGAPEA